MFVTDNPHLAGVDDHPSGMGHTLEYLQSEQANIQLGVWRSPTIRGEKVAVGLFDPTHRPFELGQLGFDTLSLEGMQTVWSKGLPMAAEGRTTLAEIGRVVVAETG